MAKNYYITLEVHDEGEWPRIAPEDLMQHVDVQLPSGLTLAHAAVSETAPRDTLKVLQDIHAHVRAFSKDRDLLAWLSAEIDKRQPDKAMHDPDHLNPAEGGNRAGDDYW